MQTVLIGVITALDKSSIFPEGSDWTTILPFFASTIGIQIALFCLCVKQAVPLLPCPLALACLLLRLSIVGAIPVQSLWEVKISVECG